MRLLSNELGYHVREKGAKNRKASPFGITSVKASKKTRAPIAMAQQVIMTSNEVVDCALIIVALEVNSDIVAMFSSF
jgi:hypothetical protein